MFEPIPIQLLGVSYSQEGKGRGREALLYSPSVPDADLAAPEVLHQPIQTWAAVQSSIEQVKRCVEELVRLALAGEMREGIALETAARALALQVLPRHGLERILSSGFHPHFDIVQDRAAEIPWELLEDPRPICSQCNGSPPGYDPAGIAFSFCPVHREKLRTDGVKLSQRFHLSHLSRGPGKTSERADYFLFVEDPLGDLAHPDRDPTGECRDHLQRLRKQMQSMGYRIHVLAGGVATRGRFLGAIADPSVAGIYYFGHGRFPKDGDEGFLALADGEISAGEIMAAGPAARFVFLNACEGAAGGPRWDLDKRGGSIADAFARGGGKVVIAPLWPVVNIQAAQSAVEFFRHAADGIPLGHAMMAVRNWSLRLYEQKLPQISWMAYRFYGDPNRRLQPACSVPSSPLNAALSKETNRSIFGNDGSLEKSAFDFDMAGVLLRADVRRESHGRAQIDVTDFVAGFAHKGDLLRHVLLETKVDPDELYRQLISTPAPSMSRDSNSSLDGARRHDLSHPFPRTRLSNDLVSVLTRAFEISQALGSQAAVRERHVHEAITAMDLWRGVPGLPLDMKAALDAAQGSSHIDDNGRWRLDGLDSDSLAVVEIAHAIAQQRGAFPITHRVTLAALLTDPKGYAAQLFTAVGVDRRLIFVIALAGSDQEPQGHHQFALSSEACGRIVGPMIQEAHRLALLGTDTVSRKVTPRDLFRAFCVKAAVPFKEGMRKPPIPFDLDVMAVMEPESLNCVANENEDGRGESWDRGRFDDGAWRIIVHAGELAWRQGHSSIRSPHLFASLIDEDPRAIRRAGLEPAPMRAAALYIVKPQRLLTADSFRLSASEATFRVLRSTLEHDAGAPHTQVNGAGLLRALLADKDGTVTQMLKQLVPDWQGFDGRRNET